MFGPNISRKLDVQVPYHHRSEEFVTIHGDLVALFRDKFAIPKNYEILFYTGSGTLCIESFISHFDGALSIRSDDLTKDKFAQRWVNIARHYGKLDETSPHELVVHYETSHSKVNDIRNATFVDAVSSFPYFETPTSPAWATVSSKILGSVPVLGIMVIDRDFLENNMTKESPSYMNPRSHRTYQSEGQTPFTPALPLFADLYEQLRSFDVHAMRDTIRTNHALIRDALGEENLINSDLSPVITVKSGVIPDELARKWKLYGYLSKDVPQKLQIFLYAEEPELYEQLATDLAREKNA